MSLNHKAFVAITVHLAQEGKPLALVLDIIEVVKVCTKDLHCGTIN